jgi:hypothetical protein
LCRSSEDRPVFLFQPEAFLILERLEHDPHILEENWVGRYPREELEHLSIATMRTIRPGGFNRLGVKGSLSATSSIAASEVNITIAAVEVMKERGGL